MIKYLSLIFLIFLSFATLETNAQNPLEIKINGVNNKIADNIKANLSITDEVFDIDTNLIDNYISQIEIETIDAMKPFGYYNPKIKIDLQYKQKQWSLVLKIKKGKPITITTIKNTIVTAENNSDFADVTKSFPIHTSDILNQELYDQYKSKLTRTAENLGYFEAKFEKSEIIIKPKAKTATISLIFITGPRYKFGETKFTNQEYDHSFLHKFITYKHSDNFDSQLLIKLQADLDGTDFFKLVDISMDKDTGDSKSVTVNIRLQNKKRYYYQYGLGYGTDTSYRTSFTWSFRRINSIGHHLDNSYKFSQYSKSTALNYYIPARFPAQQMFILNTSLTSDENPKRNNDINIRSIGASFTNKSEDQRRNQIYSLNYKQENYQTPLKSETAALLLASSNFEWLTTSNRWHPNSGGKLALNIRGASKPIASSLSFLQANVTAKYIRSLFFETRILTRVNIGATALNDINLLPPSLRFYAGGDNSIRGYAYQSLAPKSNINGREIIIGASKILTASLELDKKIHKNFSVAVFVDHGNAMESFTDARNTGYGLGLRYLSPLGQIRLDYAIAANKPDRPFFIHFNLGPDL